MTSGTLTAEAEVAATTVWTLAGGLTEREPFLNRHPVLFYGWAVWHRVAFLRRLGY